MDWYMDNTLRFEDLSWTDHSQVRQAHRFIADIHVWMAIKLGKRFHRHGQIHFTVRAKDIPADKAYKPIFQQLIGVTIVADRRFPEIITVYRDRKSANSRLRKKSKRHRPRRQINLFH